MSNGFANGDINGITNGKANGHRTEALNLSIMGIGVEYPPHRVGPEALQTLADRYYPKSPAYVRLSSTISVSLLFALSSCSASFIFTSQLTYQQADQSPVDQSIYWH